MNRMHRMTPASYGPFEKLVAAIIADQKPKRRQVLLHKSMPSDDQQAKPALTIEQQLQLVDAAVVTGRLSGHDGMQAQTLLKSGSPLTAGFLAALGA